MNDERMTNNRLSVIQANVFMAEKYKKSIRHMGKCFFEWFWLLSANY